MTKTLRDYQVDLSSKGVEILRDKGLVYLCMSVRTGKTATSMQIANLYGAKSVLFLTKKKAMSDILGDYNDFGFKFLPPVGTDVSEALEITKYQSPAEKAGVPKAKLNYLPFGIPKTDEERYQNLKPMDLHLGEKVTITQKVDGSSFTAYCVLPGHSNNKELERGICSRSLVLQEEGDSKYHLAEKKYDLLNKLEAYCVKHNCSLAVRGEIYGQGIQAFSNNPHSKLPLDLAVFSVYNIKEQQYERNNRVALFDYRNVAGALGLPTVPELEPSTFITLEKIHEYENSTEKMEGVVIKGVNFSYKVINLNYDSKK